MTKREFVKQWVRAQAILRMFDADLPAASRVVAIRFGGWRVKL
jgi:hypothetical protein